MLSTKIQTYKMRREHVNNTTRAWNRMQGFFSCFLVTSHITIAIDAQVVGFQGGCIGASYNKSKNCSGLSKVALYYISSKSRGVVGATLANLGLVVCQLASWLCMYG